MLRYVKMEFILNSCFDHCYIFEDRFGHMRREVIDAGREDLSPPEKINMERSKISGRTLDTGTCGHTERHFQ